MVPPRLRTLFPVLVAGLAMAGLPGCSSKGDAEATEGGDAEQARGGAEAASGSSNMQGPEDCGNDKDDDGDGLVDCQDGECASDPACSTGPGGDDDSSAVSPAEGAMGPENCDDLKDDDGDGLVDCKDPDCARDPACLADPDQEAEGAKRGASGSDWNPADVSHLPEGIGIGQRAPDFELPYIGRPGTQKLSDLRGQVVLLCFWASWCGPCRQEIPALELTWQLYKEQNVSVIGISVDEKPKFAGEFLGMFPVSYPMVIDKAGATVAAPWRVSSIPVSVLLDRNGVVVERRTGYTARQLRTTLTRIDDLLRAP